MLDTITKRRIDDCRDIFVGKLPDPKSQIEQITIGLIYKFMDDMDKEAIELGGTAKFFSGKYEQYSWDNLFDTKVTAAEMLRLYSEAIESMEKNPNIPELFSNIFKNAYLPYRDPETLKMFLKTIAEFEYTHSEKLGDAFEYLLSVMGSQGDAGQFRTPRHIIDFLVAAVNPSKTDTIMDPACGTAGFLISAFKHIIDRDALQCVFTTPDERKKIINNFVGYDISPDMVRMSLVNMYLHGFSEPHIFEYDTLSSEERWDESFDVILANPPFMSPKGGIRPHKKFSISSNRSEVLFVDYIAEHLNPTGKAGIIVPEGIIFQSGKAYKELRKMLVDNYLYAVVSLPAGVFNPYSGVKTSILLMDKTVAKKTNDILFIKIDNDGYNLGSQRNAIKGGQLDDAVQLIHQFVTSPEIEITNPIAHSVPKTEIAKNGDYNLSGEKYKKVVLGETDFQLFELEELFDIKRGGSPRPIEDYITEEDNGINWIKIGDVEEGTKFITSTRQKIKPEGLKKTRLVEPGDFILSNSMSYGRPYIVNIKGAIHDGWLVLKRKKSDINKDYIFSILSSDFVKQQFTQSATGGVVKNLNIELVKKVKIPLPPLSIQEEIVAEIENYQKIIDGAKMIVDNYKPKIDIDADWEMVELGEICEHITKGTTPTTNGFQWQETGINFIKIQNINNDGTISNDKMSYISQECYESLKRSQLQKNDVLFSIAGTQMGITGIVDSSLLPANTNQALAIIRSKGEYVPEFIKHYLMSTNVQNDMERLKVGVAQSNLSLKQVSEIEIPLIDIITQQKIVTQIENEQKLVNASKELIAIYEQKIKDRIAKVWGN